MVNVSIIVLNIPDNFFSSSPVTYQVTGLYAMDIFWRFLDMIYDFQSRGQIIGYSYFKINSSISVKLMDQHLSSVIWIRVALIRRTYVLEEHIASIFRVTKLWHLLNWRWYEECRLMGCCAVRLLWEPTFRGERIASFIRVIGIGELGTALEVISN
jgi:hypothetical protein